MLAKFDSFTGRIIAKRGEYIYRDLYQDEYEKNFGGQYVVIEVLTKRAYVSESAAGAVTKAKTNDPNGLFHLIAIRESPKRVKYYLMKLLDYLRRLGDIKLS